MINKSKQCLVASKKKKLFKELKSKLFKASERILILLMNQKVHDIIMKNLLESLLIVHKMIFQNLSSEINEKESETKENKIIIVSEKVINE